MEGIYRELFALREAKVALDRVVMIAPAHVQNFIAGHNTTASSGRNRGVGSALSGTSLSKRATTASARKEQVNRFSAFSATSAVGGGDRGGRAGDVAAARARAGGAGTKRLSTRRVLAELQLDPDLPLPLPTFPGHGHIKALGGVVQQEQRLQQAGVHRRRSNNKRPLHEDGLPKNLKHTSSDIKVAEVQQHHGYFVPGVVTPRQRQSHGLPRELRAISTVPTPEQRPLRAASSGGKRRRVRSRPSAASIKSATATATRSGLQEAAVMSENRRVRVSSPRPDPGSAAAVALSREQRRYTSQAVDELRKEMRQREGRLERELDRLRRSRSQGAGPTSPSAFGGASDREPSKAVSKDAAAGGRGGAVLANRGRGSRGRRPLPRAPASRKKPAVASSAPVEEGNDRRREEPDSSQPAKTVDAQAQTADDRVHLFLHPPPTIGDALRTAADKRQAVPKAVPANKCNDQAQQTRRGMDHGGSRYFDDASFTSSSVSEGDVGLGGRLRGGRHESPPPPVVFIEGEGRNAAWRPSDDDRLLRGGGGGNGGGSLRSGGVTSGAGAEVMREVVDGGNARLVLISAAEDKGAVADSGPRTIRVTNGRLEASASESEQFAAGLHDDVWVELAGMLGLSASEPSAAGLSNTSAPAEPPPAGEEVKPLTKVPMVSPELLDLMREVVGQQRDMGEERSALLQVEPCLF